MLTERNMPLYRDADESGRIGVRGYLSIFQDKMALFMHNIDKDNDIIRKKYNACWIFAKCRICIYEEADFRDTLDTSIWHEDTGTEAYNYMNCLMGRREDIYCAVKLQSCLMDIEKGRLVKRSVIEYPETAMEDAKGMAGEFSKSKADTISGEEAYTHKVVYTDLDNNHHMNNMKYTELFLNAFDADFYRKNMIKTFEIHYVSQCFEGEIIKVFKEFKGDQILLKAVHENGDAAAVCSMETEER